MRWVADLTLMMVDKVQLRYWVTNLTLSKSRMADGFFFFGQSCCDCIEFVSYITKKSLCPDLKAIFFE